jgi:hypothetical protein
MVRFEIETTIRRQELLVRGWAWIIQSSRAIANQQFRVLLAKLIIFPSKTPVSDLGG